MGVELDQIFGIIAAAFPLFAAEQRIAMRQSVA